MRTLYITPKADSDLVDIWLYTFDTWGADQADKYIDKLESSMEHLTVNPLLGVDYDYIRSGYRKFRIEHHDVFYRPLQSQILIIRVLHEGMDAPRRLA